MGKKTKIYSYHDLSSDAQSKAEFDYATDYNPKIVEVMGRKLNQANRFLHKNADGLNMKFSEDGTLVSRD